MDTNWKPFFPEDMDQINLSVLEVLASAFLDILRIGTILYLPVTSKDIFKKEVQSESFVKMDWQGQSPR